MAPISKCATVPVMMDLEMKLQEEIFNQSLSNVASGIVNLMTPEEMLESVRKRIFSRRLIISMTKQKYTDLSLKLLSRKTCLGNVLRALLTEEREDFQQNFIRNRCRKAKLNALLLLGTKRFWDRKGDVQIYGEGWKEKSVDQLYPTTDEDTSNESHVKPSIHSMKARRKLKQNEMKERIRRQQNENCSESKGINGQCSSQDVSEVSTSSSGVIGSPAVEGSSSGVTRPPMKDGDKSKDSKPRRKKDKRTTPGRKEKVQNKRKSTHDDQVWNISIW